MVPVVAPKQSEPSTEIGALTVVKGLQERYIALVMTGLDIEEISAPSFRKNELAPLVTGSQPIKAELVA